VGDGGCGQGTVVKLGHNAIDGFSCCNVIKQIFKQTNCVCYKATDLCKIYKNQLADKHMYVSFLSLHILYFVYSQNCVWVETVFLYNMQTLI